MRYGPMGAGAGAGHAADAAVLVDVGFARRMLLHLARSAAAAHADVLERPAEAGLVVPLEMGERDKDIRVHDRAADLGILHMDAARHGHLHVVGPLEAVGDDDLAAGRERAETVCCRRVQVVERVFSLSDIQRVAVCEEGLATRLSHEVGDDARIVGAQEAQVAGLPEMHLDRHELVREVHVGKTRLAAEPLQHLRAARLAMGAEVAPPHLGRRCCLGACLVLCHAGLLSHCFPR